MVPEVGTVHRDRNVHIDLEIVKGQKGKDFAIGRSEVYEAHLCTLYHRSNFPPTPSLPAWIQSLVVEGFCPSLPSALPTSLSASSSSLPWVFF